MVRCLYKKFTIRKGIPFEISEFNRITMLIGKLAYDTLLSGNPLLQRSRVLAEVGPDAFDYGLLIGHEDGPQIDKRRNCGYLYYLSAPKYSGISRGILFRLVSK